MDEIYEYSYLTVYHRSEEHVNTYDKYETFFKGYYYKNYYDNTYSTDADEVVVLGCKTYANWPEPSTWATTAVFPDPVYGLCMQGWIHTIEIWTPRDAAHGVAGKYNTNWDYIFNADTDSRTSFETDFVE